MTVHVARTILVKHRQDFNRDRLPWLPNATVPYLAGSITEVSGAGARLLKPGQSRNGPNKKDKFGTRALLCPWRPPTL